MSKVLEIKLRQSMESGELDNIVEMASSFRELQKAFGYAGSKGQYTHIIREYLVLNGIKYTHFTDSGAKKSKDIEKVCEVCGKVFIRPYSKKAYMQRTCSYSCSNTLFRSGINNANYKEGEKSSYRKKAFEHFPNECALCGYSENKAALVVHHIDENRKNNDLDNLVILCANCHAIEHWS